MKANEHVYLKKLADHNSMEVWLVDGALVRRDLDENFTEYDYHARWKWIPTNEIWIEKETNEDEWKYFLENVDREREYLAQGMSLAEAVEKANEQEKEERRKSPRVRGILEARDRRTEALAKIHKEKWLEYSNEKLAVWIIDGELVRGLYMVEYAGGGHDLVYDWVPKGEVWIEEVLEPEDRKYILLHELHERALMHGGKDYHHAHEGATIIEDRYRENPEGLDERIKEEWLKNQF